MGIGADWSSFFKAKTTLSNGTQLSREYIAQWLDDQTETAGSSDTVTIDGIADKDHEGEDVKIDKGIFKTWVLGNIAIGKEGTQGQSYKLLKSVGLTSGDSFQIYDESTQMAFQSVQGYLEGNEIKAKIVNAEAYKEERDKITTENTPFSQTELDAIPAAVKQAQQSEEVASQSNSFDNSSETERTLSTEPEINTAETESTSTGTGIDLNEVVQIIVNGDPANYKLGDIVAALSDSRIGDILTLMSGETISGNDNRKYQIPKDVLQKALFAILTDPKAQNNFIDQFTTVEHAKALKEFLGAENFNVVLNSLPEAQKTRLNGLLGTQNDPNELVEVLVKASTNGAFIAQKVNLAWIATKLINLDAAELIKLFKGQEALFPTNSGSGTYSVKIKPAHLKAALNILAKDPAELAKLTSKLASLDDFNAFINFIGKDPKAARQLLLQLEPQEIIRILGGSDSFDELVKILEVKNAKEIWAKLASFDGKNLRSLLEKADSTGKTLFEKLKLGNTIDEAFNEIKNIPMPKPSVSFTKSSPIDFNNTDWPKEIDLASPKGKWIQPNTFNANGLKQLLLNLDKTQLQQFIQAKGSDEVIDLLLKLKPEEIAEILSKPDFISYLKSAKFAGATTTSSLDDLVTALKLKPENLAQILNKLEPDLLNNFLRPLETNLREDLLKSIKGAKNLKNSPLNQILSKLDDAQLQSLLSLKNRSGEQLFKVLDSTANSADDVLKAIKPQANAATANSVLKALENLAGKVKNIQFLGTIGKALKPAMPLLQKVAKVIPILAPLIDFITGLFEGEGVAKSAAGTIGSFAGGWAGGALGAVTGASVAAYVTTALTVGSLGTLGLPAVAIGGILAATVTLLGAIAGSAGGGWIGDRLYEALESMGVLPKGS